MNRVEYNQYIKQVEERFAGKPEALRRKALFYVILSYIYLVGILVLSVALLAGIIALIVFFPGAATIKIGIVLGIAVLVFGFSIVRGLWVKTPPPTGRVLHRREAPALFSMLDDLRDKVAPVSFHKVIIDGDFNAAVVQHPRLGMLGWYQNYLLLGLPLMQALGKREFTGVLAHEFAHLSNRDGSSGNWIYRIRSSWDTTIEKLFESGGSGSWALMPFVNWFWPRFNGHAFVLSRLHEYRADAAAADYAGTDPMSRALQRVELQARWIDEEVWPKIFQKANDEPEVPEDVFQQARERINDHIPDEKAANWLRQSFSRITDYSDTHPALMDRLKSIDAVPKTVLAGDYQNTLDGVPVTAAEAFLGGETEKKLMNELSKEWADALREMWKQRHAEVQEVREKLGDESEVSDAEGAWEWANAMLNLEGGDAALPWIEKTLGYEPGHPGARFVKAQHLLEKENSDALPLLEELASEKGALSLDALGLLRHHYTMRGDAEGLSAIDRRIDEMESILAKAEQERSAVTAKDSFSPHGLSEKMRFKISEFAKNHPKIKALHIALKDVQFLKDEKFHAIAVTREGLTGSDESVMNEVLDALAEIMENGYYVLLAKGEMKAAAKKIQAVEGSLIFGKE